jgi:hypothetical protein
MSATRRSLNFGSTASKEVTNSGDVASHKSDEIDEMNLTANSATIMTTASSDRVQTPHPLTPKTPKTPKTPTTHRVIEMYPDVELPSEESSSRSGNNINVSNGEPKPAESSSSSQSDQSSSEESSSSSSS